MDPISEYCQSVAEAVRRIQSEQRDAMTAVAALLADKVESGRSIYMTGCSHSSLFAQEAYYRAGGFFAHQSDFPARHDARRSSGDAHEPI
ncbi:SIS domain-containing protein [Cohnella ginsengisoli]|uniref:SIS domain-containing protein n=1 Tax=Cohnella ginsengisoli TaxID=425004 RepID=A0A9X4KI15_9BACL|nr:SIS domain-containing protein [Cohnella ginsengisoli]MDG0792370.1 SIS domain-containing protein [Cohnella ginsengisoli]